MTSYDYIIVGAGSAGCLLAARLSAKPDLRVLLVEAGGPDSQVNVHMPAAYSRLHRSDVDYGFSSEGQAETDGRAIYQPRGKVLGGCSSTNCMAYVRGDKLDYDDWAAAGNESWDFDSVLPFFKRHERSLVHHSDYHGRDGELTVSRANGVGLAGKAFLDACQAVGIPRNPDYNGAQLDGCSAFQFTIRNGKRLSAYRAFLHPVRKRPNLDIWTGARATHLTYADDEASPRVNGVELIKGSQRIQVRASREVILSAGAFASPQLLMCSGIGDPAVLAKAGVALRHKLPGVGRNLQDHPFVPMGFYTPGVPSLNSVTSIKNLARYFIGGSGPLTRAPLEAVAFVRTRDGLDRSDIELQFAPGQGIDLYDYSKFEQGVDGFTIFPTLLKPQSRGQVSIATGDSADAPVIEQAYLTDTVGHDRRSLIAGMRLVDQLVAQPQLRSMVKGSVQPKMPDDTEDAYAARLAATIESCYHPVGTCAMGSDADAVVDAKLRVHGVRGLRVVDASIMPTIVAGNTNAPTYMIAEKAAAMILAAQAVPA